jgi:hypothetical protein
MAIVIQSTFDASEFQRKLRTLPKQIQDDVGEGMFLIAKNYQRWLRYSLSISSERFEWKIYNGTRAVKLSNNRSVVKMPIEGVWLDSMIPHHVSLKPGRKISQWARARGIKANVLFVRPHPFIDAGLRRGAVTRNKILKSVTKKAFGG